jgi:flagellar biosynthetic protein FliO
MNTTTTAARRRAARLLTVAALCALPLLAAPASLALADEETFAAPGETAIADLAAEPAAGLALADDAPGIVAVTTLADDSLDAVAAGESDDAQDNLAAAMPDAAGDEAAADPAALAATQQPEPAAAPALATQEPEPAAAPAPAAQPTRLTAGAAEPGAASARPLYAAEPLDWPGATLDVTIKLVLVLALAYGALWLLRRNSLGGPLGRRAGELQVLESATLAPNRSVYLVRAGDRRLLLGVTTNQITTLSAWDDDGAPAAATTPTFDTALDAATAAPRPPAS